MVAAAWFLVTYIQPHLSPRFRFCRPFRPPIVQIGRFAVSEEELGKNLGPYVLARLRELAEPVRLDALYETNVLLLGDHFGVTNELTFLKDVPISVPGFDLLPKAVSAVFSWIPNDQYIAEARPQPGTHGNVLHLELLGPGGSKVKEWLIRPQRRSVDDALSGHDKIFNGRLPLADAAGDNKNASSIQLIDRAIYTLVHFMYHDPDAPNYWREQRERTQKYSTPGELQAYFSGMRHFISYLRSFDHNELVGARQEFELLREEKPRFVPGLMMLALTLSEMRDEREAIQVYRRAEDELDDLLRRKPSKDQTKTRFQAKLFKAVAHRKLYRWKELHAALRELAALEQEVNEELDNLSSDQDRTEFEKIHLAVLTEKATSIGYYLVLLYFGNFADALTHKSVPSELAPDEVEREQLLSGISRAGTSMKMPELSGTAHLAMRLTRSGLRRRTF